MVQSNVARVNGGGVYEINPVQAEVGIQAAIDSLPSTGGVVDIYPGSAEYKFSAAVISTKDNVRLNLHGAQLEFLDATSLYMFRIQGKNWIIDGGKFVDNPGSSLGTNTRRIISIEDASAGSSKIARILNCIFEVTLATQAVRNYMCISAVGSVAASSTMRHGLFVSGCTFIAGVNSIPETKYVTATTTPHGITFIKTLRSGGQHIHDNLFIGNVESSTLANVPDGADPQLLEMAINATVAIGGTTVVFKSTASDPTLTGNIQPGSTFTVAGDSQIYKVTKFATSGSNLISVIFYPALVVQADANDVVVITATTTYGHVASAITIEDGNQSNVHDNTLKLLTCQAAASGEGGSLIFMTRDTGEGGHSKIHDNLIEDVDAKYIVELLGDGALEKLGWVHVNNNTFGRVIPRVEAAVRLELCEVFKVMGNNFHNVEGGLHGTTDTHGYGIDYVDCRTGTIALNDWSLSPLNLSARNAIHDGGGNENVHVLNDNVIEYSYS